MKLLLVGATGLVGSEVLRQALDDPRISQVVAPTRCALAVHPKLHAPLTDFDNLLKTVDWWRADSVICTLGTTMRRAGSKDSFRLVDYEYPLRVARLARMNGTSAYVLNSATGANPNSSFFYNRVKGELETSLTGLGFESLTYVRPGVISGKRNELRLGERALVFALGLAGRLLPARWQLNPASRIAQLLLESALEHRPGVHIITSERCI
ncbi:NAD-dependent epimerase/dehydratase family protein [Pseudomonas sp. DTU12.1]|uniref:NAD-dependent epimerase/dehydratase family protein n=1 Tax=Pseudomonas sp. DTU12.1 TaxID=2654238 RepID=UPI00132EB840|nr:NAD-dependent epimerase/dehydratase family protein [Pseudomonas sp. DTU12.1]QHG23853.1 NAD-dependent dehydratase [Pseudomonas sp. DTU12.1]